MRSMVALLLWLFPSRFRREFAEDLLATFDDRWRERGGWKLAARTVADLTRSAVLQHLAEVPPPSSRKGDGFMTTLWQDLRFGVRTLSKTPGFTAVAVVTLALGIGANTAIYSVVNAVLFKAVRFPHADRLVFLNESLPKATYMNVAWPDYMDWRSQNQVFVEMAAFQPNSMQFQGSDEPKVVQAGWVSSSFFPMLGAQMFLGRAFSAKEETPGAPPLAVVSYRFWQDELKGDRQVVGRAIPFASGPMTVAGVLAPEFQFGPWEMDVCVPVGLRSSEPEFTQRSNHPGLIVVAEMRPGVTIERARADLNVIMARLAKAYPESNRDETAEVVPIAQLLVGFVRGDVLMLLGAVACVLLIACANVAHLALARAAGRRREFAVRAAVGASRGRLVRQMLAESALLSLAGGAAGLMLAYWCLPSLIAMYPHKFFWLKEVRLDSGVLLCTLGVCLLAGTLFGLGPMLLALRSGLAPSLKEGSGKRLRSVLFVAEIAVAIVLTVGSALLLRSLAAVMDEDPGFRADHLLTLRVAHAGDGPATRHLQFFEQALDRIAQEPGVESASAVMCPPIAGTCWTSPYVAVGQTTPPSVQQPWTAMNMVMPGYFETLRVPLMEGRMFQAGDAAGATRVAIVNQTMARLLWPGASAVGRHITVTYGGGDLEVVGVVGSVRQFGLEERPVTEVYVPAPQMPVSFMTMVVRTKVEPASMAGGAVAAIRSVNRSQAVSRVVPMTELIGRSVARRKFAAFLLGLFGALSLLLSVVGVGGIMAYTVAQRTREFGIRLAVGAQPGQVWRLVLGHGLRLTAMGVGLGQAAAWGLTRLIASMLFHVKSHDAVTFAAVAGVLTVAALAACLLPARRASRVDPVTALRWD